MFNPELSIGQILKNADIVDKFKCGIVGGMKRSKTTNTLVIVSDYTKGIFNDKWLVTIFGDLARIDIDFDGVKPLLEISNKMKVV